MVLLSDLFHQAPSVEILGLNVDSRKKRSQSIFFCIKGMKHDGHLHVDEAIANGAICVVYSEPIETFDSHVTYVKVVDVLTTYNEVAHIYYGKPSSSLLMIGITGTNGKSSIAKMCKNILDNFYPTGYIGTIAIEYSNVKLDSNLTTPDVDDIHGILHDMVEAGVKACALEVSSIGIEQRRIDSVDFDVAIFTNFTHDHLDYHGTMENYFEAKKRFFDILKPGSVAITNIDDPKGLAIVKDTKAKVFTVAINNKADFQAKDIQCLNNRTIFTLRCFDLEYRIETNLLAQFNIYNLLAVIAACYSQGYHIEQLLPYLKSFKQIEGRMERIEEGQPFNVIVDFAHTPDGLQQVMSYAETITPKGNRIIAVFSSAGKRDYKKRPIFGKIADKYCDMIILTEDDPRDESVFDINQEIASGIVDTNYIIIESRYDAIRQAIELANPKDTILILGKADETFIHREFGREYYMGDHKAAKEIIHHFYFHENDGDN